VRSAATAGTPENAAGKLVETIENDLIDYRRNARAHR